MHTLERLELCLRIAEELGYGVRREWMGGVAGGVCEFGGKRWVFVDLALGVEEQLEQVRAVLLADPVIHQSRLSPDSLVSLGLRTA